MEASRDECRKLKVLMGTCGWSDDTLLRCGRFYPASVRSAEDRLRHYSTHFPCVEVDTSTYAIPSKASVQRWLQSVPPGFVFHFKAFGLFCSKSCPFTAIPGNIRSKLPPVRGENNIKLSSLSKCTQDEVWSAFNSVLEPAFLAGALGVVLFQFHLSFKPSAENRAHVLWCRSHLDSRFSMAVEFRNRDWFAGDHFQATCDWLKENKLAFVAADELAHETFQKDREQIGLLEGQKRLLLPVAWTVTQPSFHYIRVHRREGSRRLLSETELQKWVARLQTKLHETLQGPIYFMWGTDWEDQPIKNTQNLTRLLPTNMIFNWKASQRAAPSRGSLLSLFKIAQTLPLQTTTIVSNVKNPEITTSDSFNHLEQIAPQSTLLGNEVKALLESPTEKLGLTRKRFSEQSVDAVQPIKKPISSPLVKYAKSTPQKMKKSSSRPAAAACMITSFFKPTSSDT